MHRSRLPLTKWILAIALLVNARKGVSACQIARDLQVTYKTAWYLGHRIRRAMRELSWMQKFTGICELDECYLGGKCRGKRGRGAGNKTPVFGMRERNGKVRLRIMSKITGQNIREAVHRYIDTNSKMVVADQYVAYDQLAAEFTLARIDHTREYVRGQIHTNSIESIWAIIKRQAHGTHHWMSPQYLPLYLSEISYRFNHKDDHKLFLKVLRNALLTDKQIA
jgi:transposase-like protein